MRIKFFTNNRTRLVMGVIGIPGTVVIDCIAHVLFRHQLYYGLTFLTDNKKRR